MTQQVMQTDAASLANVKIIKILSLISIACSILCIIGSFIGIVLAIIALVLGNKVQHIYLADNPNPLTWSDSPDLLKGMVFTIIGFVINALIVAFFTNYIISSTMANIKI